MMRVYKEYDMITMTQHDYDIIQDLYEKMKSHLETGSAKPGRVPDDVFNKYPPPIFDSKIPYNPVTDDSDVWPRSAERDILSSRSLEELYRTFSTFIHS